MSGGDEYLLAVYMEAQRGPTPVTPGRIATRLEKSSPSVTEMLQRLDDEGLVSYEAYKGVTLTDTGRTRAEELHESYVTLSWFFRSVLDLDDHETEAMEMAGVLDPSVADRLTATLPIDELHEDEPEDPV